MEDYSLLRNILASNEELKRKLEETEKKCKWAMDELDKALAELRNVKMMLLREMEKEC